MVVDAVKYNSLKCAIIDSYNKVMLKMNRGYPLENQNEILEAIYAVKYMTNNNSQIDEVKVIVNHFLIKL